MEKSIEKNYFSVEIPPSQLSPLSLAYIGDAVYEMYIRSYIMKDCNMPVAKLHKAATRFVSATSQAEIVKNISDEFTDEEMSVYKRGRNAHSYTSAKNADIVDYRMATGLEALIGYLYIKKETGRLEEIIARSIDVINAEK